MIDFDAALFSALNSLAGHSAFFDAVIVFFGVFAITLFVPLFLLDKETRNKKMILAALIALCGAYATDASLGLAVYRDRPFLDHSVNQLIDVFMPTKSFPSDHSALSFAAATVFFLASRRTPLSFLVFLFAAFIGLARIIGGVHYPLDVIVGAVVGVGWGIGAYHLSKKYD
ncbi:phosphatase PAP2 family protein [Candidatus Uhrbacteria bacterium]|nr:phosphatase PAP2 family protein [Candidatus Uhrbacteria bacterium]